MNKPLSSMLWDALFDYDSPWRVIILATIAALIVLGVLFRKRLSATTWLRIGVVVQTLALVSVLGSFYLAVQTNSLAGLGFIAYLTFPALCIWSIVSVALFLIAKKKRKEGLEVPLHPVIYVSGILAFLIGGALLLFIAFLMLTAG